MQQLKLNVWNEIKKIFCYYTGIRFSAEKKVRPWKRYDRLVDISISWLKGIIKDENIKTIILDMDGTLKHYKKGLLKENRKWVNEIKKYVNVYIVSNANKRYTSEVANELNVPYIYKAKKPKANCFWMVCKKTKCKQNEIIMIGDSIKNDIIGASKFGIKKTILLNDLCLLGLNKEENEFEKFYYYAFYFILFFMLGIVIELITNGSIKGLFGAIYGFSNIILMKINNDKKILFFLSMILLFILYYYISIKIWNNFILAISSIGLMIFVYLLKTYINLIYNKLLIINKNKLFGTIHIFIWIILVYFIIF